MNCLRQVMVVGAVFMAAAPGCGDNGLPDTGQIDMLIGVVPTDVTSIHVEVTAFDIPQGVVFSDLVENNGSWSGPLLNVPPGVSRTVTAWGYADGALLIYKGSTENVTVSSGKLTSVTIHLLRYPPDPGGPGFNTPPHFVEVTHPDTMATNETGGLMARAIDLDDNAVLTYTWTSTPPGTFWDFNVDDDDDGHIVVNRSSGDPVEVLYTPQPGFTGYAIIQVSVSDGHAAVTTTFPIAVGSGISPGIHFDELPGLEITGVQRQVLMPNGSTGISYTLTNPGTQWSADPMHLHTSWTSTCGGAFASEDHADVDVAKGTPVSRSVTYTASSGVPSGVAPCGLELLVTDDFSGSITSGVIVWIEEPLAVFVTSGSVDGARFAGESAAADAYCQFYASTAGVPQGPYKALLSFDEISAMDRIVDGPYVLPYGDPRLPIARSKAELFSLNLLGSIHQDENGENVDGNVFTGTDAAGLPATRCANWTSNSPSDDAMGGLTQATDGSWVAFEPLACDQPAHVYCFQQSHVLN